MHWQIGVSLVPKNIYPGLHLNVIQAQKLYLFESFWCDLSKESEAVIGNSEYPVEFQQLRGAPPGDGIV